MIFVTILKMLIVVGFLIAFLRRPSLLAGVGLLTVTSAVLLDTLLGTLNREDVIAQLGFFFYLFAGLIMAGALFWLLGTLRPYWATFMPGRETAVSVQTATPTITRKIAPAALNAADAPFDRQMLFEEMRDRLSMDDIFDVMFDLEISENEIMTMPQAMTSLIIDVMDMAAERNQNHQLALAVERALTPPPADHLPRLEKINADAPPTIIRHYLLANYSFNELQRMATRLNIDWEQLDRHNKKIFVRNLLLHLARRNGVPQLIELMHEALEPTDPTTPA